MIVVDSIHGVASLSTSILVNWEGTRLLLDVGPGTMTEMWRRRLKLRRLSAILISHAHLDHTWGLAPLIWFLKNRGWSRQITIIYPPKADPTVKGLVVASGAAELANLTPLSPEDPPLTLGRLTIQALEASHPIPTNGYLITETPRRLLDTNRLNAEGIPRTLWPALAQGRTAQHQGRTLQPQTYTRTRQRKILYTGDTGPNPSLHTHARNADLLIADATWLHPQWETPDQAPHLTLRQALQLAQQTQAQRLLLTHLTSRIPIQDFQREAAQIQRELNITTLIYLPTAIRIEIP